MVGMFGFGAARISGSFGADEQPTTMSRALTAARTAAGNLRLRVVSMP